MASQDIIPNLFRTEYGKIVAVLTKSFGLEHMEQAEDIASETFLQAMDTWPYKGIPKNPAAWLYTVAKNKAINQLKRDAVFRNKITEALRVQGGPGDAMELVLTEEHIADSQLQMLFAICHPSLRPEAQISLALRVLCGFGIDEIATALLCRKETINKRLQRARAKLKAGHIQLNVPSIRELKVRLDIVLRTIYLLFSEGYYSESRDTVVRKELCLEAMNLIYLLLQNAQTATHDTCSLMALMCFHSSRLDARQSEEGDMILYRDQDESLWDTSLVEKGFLYLQQASKWEIASKYYLEASIAYWHTIKEDSLEKWESILKLYDLLLTFEKTPAALMNRIFALYKTGQKETALREAQKLNLEGNQYYYLLLGELYAGLNTEKARKSLALALENCCSETERKVIRKQMQVLGL